MTEFFYKKISNSYKQNIKYRLLRKIFHKLRNYFDLYVLMINEDDYTDINKQELKELALNSCFIVMFV